MTGSPSTDARTRADHEAGHFIAAYAQGIVARVEFLTIKQRGVIDGICALALAIGASRDALIHYHIGGIVGEVLGKLYRKYVGRAASVNPQVLEEEILAEVMEAIRSGGHGDAPKILADLDCYPPGQKPHAKDVAFSTVTLLSTHLDDLFLVSDALVERKTLFQDEAAFLVHTTKRNGAEVTRKAVDYYLLDRQPTDPPALWLEGVEGEPGVFYEGPIAFFRRIGL